MAHVVKFKMHSLQAFISVATLLAMSFASAAALAHTNDYLDTQKAPHGGQLRMAGVYHFELVVAKDSKGATNNPVMVYVTDHAGAKIQTAGTSGTVTILSGTERTTANLAPDGDNRLKGSAKYTSAPDLKAIVSIALPGKTSEQARFTPLAIPMEKHDEHMH